MSEPEGDIILEHLDGKVSMSFADYLTLNRHEGHMRGSMDMLAKQVEAQQDIIHRLLAVQEQYEQGEK